MHVIVAGSRTITADAPVFRLLDALDTTWGITCVIYGGAAGVDAIGARWAKQRGKAREPYPAIWRPAGRYNPRAGHERNERMAQIAAARGGGCVVVWDGVSAGSADMIARAKAHHLPLVVARVGDGGARAARQEAGRR